MIIDFKDLTPEEGVNYRIDCPYCGGRNTFSMIRNGGDVTYHCFRASCGYRGTKRYKRSLEELKQSKKIKDKKEFILPQYFEFGAVNDKILKVLRDKNSWDAYERGYIKVGYDPREDRLLFFLMHKGKISGAVGRSLSYNPIKSKIYPNSRGVFKAGQGATVVLVEDCFSACSISRSTDYTGVSLNGTNLNPDHLTELKNYANVVIALDKDATRKAIKLNDQLKFIGINSRVKYLEQDLKDCKELPLI